MKTSVYTRASLHPAITGTVLAAGVGLAATWLWQSRRRSRPATARRRREEPAEARSLAPMV